MKKLHRWRLALVFLLLALFLAAFILPGGGWQLFRKAALAFQLSTSLTHIGGKLLLAAVILAVTVFAGRLYCSLLCPAGLVQELFSCLGDRLRLRKLAYRPPPRNWIPAAVLAALIIVFGLTAAANLIDPIAMFGRLAEMPAAPDGVLSRLGGAVAAAAAAVSVAFLVVLPLFRGRVFCDRYCPMGGVLTVAAALPGRRPAIDADACVSCGRCAKVCPVQCIDSDRKAIDAERCVLCLDCAAACAFGAVGFRRRGLEKRRGFLAAVSAAAVFAFSREIAGRLGVTASAADGPVPVAPPGSGGNDRHHQRCVDCRSCVPACPVGIIRPNVGAALRPTLDYDYGYCQYNCTACSTSCPAGVFRRVGVEEKHRLRIASTALVLDRCVVVAQGTECGACAEVCPTHAVSMISQGEGRPTLPDFDVEYCIGCGACYHVCPAEPRAFVIRGLDRHEQAAGVRVMPSPHGSGQTAPHQQPEQQLVPDEDGVADFPF